MRRVMCIALAGLLSACAQQSHVKLYEGHELPKGEVVVVQMPDTLEVMSINGQEVPAANSMFGADTKALHLQPGEYQISAYYENIFDIGGGLSHEVVRTRSAVFSLNGEAGDRWRLTFQEPANLREAQKMENSFSGWAENLRTGERIATQAGEKPASPVKQLLGGETSSDSTKSTVAPLNSAPQAVSAPVSTPSAAAAPDQTLPHNDATLNTLQQLWLMLSPESREVFLDWAEQ
ncbi:DUF2057 domain-containing protein [Pseudomonas sp. gcc21]|uniref:DUF2057 family protein n=1 Tax=Pseudomonas sp. gcc21 TaxID=2726989 RepID=UPI0014510D80|nr:DUF2057 family protein [Pseudomonas sp. gcc21]QJD58147.1 DUF2057 domain-containing protein [Pseudomonas sp. gcc21]